MYPKLNNNIKSNENVVNYNFSPKSYDYFKQKSYAINKKPKLSIIKFLLRSIFITASFFGLCYQSIVICHQYLKYDTIITSDTEIKYYIELPAITLCTNWFLDHETPEEKNYTALKLMEITRNATKDWIYCTFDGYIAVEGRNVDKTNCSEVSPVVMTRSGKWKNKCFTIFSQVERGNKSDDHFRVSRRNGFIWTFIQLLNHTDWFVAFTLHSPLMIPSFRESDFMFMEIGKWYEIVFRRTKSRLLQSPWHTNCTEYGIKSKMKFKSQSECYTKCLTRERRKVCDCLSLNEDDSHRIDWMSTEDKFCTDDKVFCLKDDKPLYIKCNNECPNDCLIDSVEYTLTQQKFTDASASLLIQVGHSYAKGDSIITHFPGMDFGVFVANIGGLAGFWLGFSVISVYDKFDLLTQQLFKYFYKPKSKH